MAEQVGDPLSVLDVGLAPWNRLDVPGVDHQQLQALALEQVVERHPVNPSAPMATWLILPSASQSASSRSSRVVVPKVRVCLPLAVSTQATTVFLCTSRPQQR